MHMTYHFFTHAIAPVLIAVTEALCPATNIVSANYQELPEEPPIVQMVENPHNNASALMSYEFYKKRLYDACNRVTVGTNNIQKVEGVPVVVLPLKKDHPPDYHLRV